MSQQKGKNQLSNLPITISAKSSLHSLWWQLAVLFLMSTIAVYTSLSFREKVEGFLPEATIKASIFSKRASGLSGLFEIVERVGLKGQPWQQNYRQLKKFHGLLFIASPIESLRKIEIDQILDWVYAGNTLIYLDQFADPEGQRILQKLGLHYKIGKKLADQAFSPCPNTNGLAYVQHLILSAEARVLGGQPIAADGDGAVLTQVNYGQGRALIGTSPGLCTNQHLQSSAKSDNFQFMVNWFSTADGFLFFDEKCHGFSNASNIFSFLFHEPPGLVFNQLLLLLCLAIISHGQRFGEVKTVLSKRKISSLEFIDGLANAYERAKASLAALEIIVQDFKTKLCQELGLSPQSSKEEIALSWLAQTGSDSSNLLNFLTDYEQALRAQKITPLELTKYVLKCDELTSQMSLLRRRSRQK